MRECGLGIKGSVNLFCINSLTQAFYLGAQKAFINRGLV